MKFFFSLTSCESEHALQGLQELRITIIGLEVNLPQIRRTVHANLHVNPRGRLRLRLVLENVLPVRSDWWPPNYLCPASNRTNKSSKKKENRKSSKRPRLSKIIKRTYFGEDAAFGPSSWTSSPSCLDSDRGLLLLLLIPLLFSDSSVPGSPSRSSVASRLRSFSKLPISCSNPNRESPNKNSPKKSVLPLNF